MRQSYLAQLSCNGAAAISSKALERPLATAEAEAAFELGLITLGDGLEQASMPDIDGSKQRSCGSGKPPGPTMTAPMPSPMTRSGPWRPILACRCLCDRASRRPRGLAEHLDQLLLEPAVYGIEASLAAQLRTGVQRRSEETEASRNAKENASYPLLTDQAERFANPVINQLFRELTAAVTSCTDYQGETKDGFDALLAQILMFCADRQDAGRKQLGPRTDYLRANDTKEGDLQSDLTHFVKGNLTTAEVLTEMEGIATGRSDIYVGLGGVRFISELKRHFGAVDREVAKTYFGQAGAYQATNVRLGFPGILELAKRPGPPPTIADCLWHVDLYSRRVYAGTAFHRVPCAGHAKDALSSLWRSPFKAVSPTAAQQQSGQRSSNCHNCSRVCHVGETGKSA